MNGDFFDLLIAGIRREAAAGRAAVSPAVWQALNVAAVKPAAVRPEPEIIPAVPAREPAAEPRPRLFPVMRPPGWRRLPTGSPGADSAVFVNNAAVRYRARAIRRPG